MAEEEGLFLIDGLRRILAHDFSSHAPETVLRMAVEEPCLSGLDRRKTAEDQYFGLSVKNRRDGVDDHDVNDP